MERNESTRREPMPPSLSEDRGIALLTDQDLSVYSVGISTGGVAELRMAEANPNRRIVATTIDEQGEAFAQEQIASKEQGRRVEVRLEDVTAPLPYSDASFDYIYARLVLHYLSDEQLVTALAELHRILRPGGTFFVVVRSTDCPDAGREGVTTDPNTKLTTYQALDKKSGQLLSFHRHFHTEESIRNYLNSAGFDVTYTRQYDEQLYADFERKAIAPHVDNLIEVLARKP